MKFYVPPHGAPGRFFAVTIRIDNKNLPNKTGNFLICFLQKSMI